MRNFTWIFMAATVFVGVSACTNEDTVSNTVIEALYQFNDIDNKNPINELCPGWTQEIVSPTNDNKTWQGHIFVSNHDGSTDKYIQATARDFNNANTEKTYDLWLFSPALNVKKATQKVFSFYSRGIYWQASSSLEVYVLNEPKSTASRKELLHIKIATSDDGDYTWVASGDISLKGKGDIVYIGFRYQAQGGCCNSTTYCIDDFAFGRLQTPHYIEEDDTPAYEPKCKLITDTIYTFDNALQYAPISDIEEGWRDEIISPLDRYEDERTWQSRSYTNNSSIEKYIQASAHRGEYNNNWGISYEWWIITPALNVKDAVHKVFSFYSAGAYWEETSSLKVYLLKEPKSTDPNKELLNVKVATPDEQNYTWVASGDISLEGKGDIVYIGFCYQAQGGSNNSTTYCIDDFAFGRLQTSHYIETSETPSSELSPSSIN